MKFTATHCLETHVLVVQTQRIKTHLCKYGAVSHEMEKNKDRDGVEKQAKESRLHWNGNFLTETTRKTHYVLWKKRLKTQCHSFDDIIECIMFI